MLDFSEKIFKNILKNKNNEFIFIAEDASGTIVGFASGCNERSGNPLYKGEISSIYILLHYQRKRIGTITFSAAINLAF
jgi:GNAT superfamily N-acetyltransferase